MAWLAAVLRGSSIRCCAGFGTLLMDVHNVGARGHLFAEAAACWALRQLSEVPSSGVS